VKRQAEITQIREGESNKVSVFIGLYGDGGF